MPGVTGGMHGWRVLKTRFRREKALRALKKVQVLKQSYVLKSRFRREKALKTLKKTKIYLNVNELHVACYQSLAIFNTDVEKTTIPSRSVLFAIKLKDIKKLVFDYDA